jgi:hypothetical protein
MEENKHSEESKSHEEHKHHESEHSSRKKHSKDFTNAVRKNPWILSTIVLGAVVLIFFISSIFGFGGFSGNSISEEKAEEIFLNSIQSQGADISNVEVTDISLESELYKISFNYQGQEYPVPFYLSKDGKLIGSMGASAQEDTGEDNPVEQPTEIPKSDKPEVELFVWGYCPYGVQAQGPLAEVAVLLGKYANFSAVMYYDGHGAYETQQNKIQECIQKLYPAKYWSYASKFVSVIYPNCSSVRTEECDKTQSVKVMKTLGIDSTKILNCVDTDGAGLISDSSALAQELGVTGSPTLVINGVKANVARTAEAYKTAICEAFNSPPSECETVLSSASGTASGNC